MNWTQANWPLDDFIFPYHRSCHAAVGGAIVKAESYLFIFPKKSLE